MKENKDTFCFCMINDGTFTFITTEEENVFHLYRNDGGSIVKNISFLNLCTKIAEIYEMYLRWHLHVDKTEDKSISFYPAKDEDWTVIKVCVSEFRM